MKFLLNYFLFLNNIPILLFLLNRKIIGLIFLALFVYFIHKLVGLDLFFIIVFSTINAGNYGLIIIFFLYMILLLSNIYFYLCTHKLR